MQEIVYVEMNLMTYKKKKDLIIHDSFILKVFHLILELKVDCFSII